MSRAVERERQRERKRERKRQRERKIERADLPAMNKTEGPRCAVLAIQEREVAAETSSRCGS